MLLAILATTAIGAFQGSIVALIGVPSFVVTLAGYEIWNGVIFKGLPGVITIQGNKINDFSNYLFSATAGWVIGGDRQRRVRRRDALDARLRPRHGIAVRDPIVFVAEGGGRRRRSRSSRSGS